MAASGGSCPAAMKATSQGAFQKENPLDFALPLIILQICLVVVVTRGLAYLLRPLRQPRVIAEIIVSPPSAMATCSASVVLWTNPVRPGAPRVSLGRLRRAVFPSASLSLSLSCCLLALSLSVSLFPSENLHVLRGEGSVNSQLLNFVVLGCEGAENLAQVEQ